MQKKIPTTRPSIFRLAAIAIFALVAAFCAALMAGCTQYRDDSDMPDGRSSGLIVRTDALTGCQYLEASGRGLTPRIGRDGKQVCAALMVGAK